MLRKLLAYARGLLRSRSLDQYKPFRLEGRLIINKRHGSIRIGAKTQLWPDVKISVIGTRKQPAEVRIGSLSILGDRTQIHACRLVEIGDRVAISWDCTLLENNYHAASKGPIRLEDDVWIGCHTIILAGVTIGRGSMIGAGSVVTKSIPPGVIAAGNPARVIREITPDFHVDTGWSASE